MRYHRKGNKMIHEYSNEIKEIPAGIVNELNMQFDDVIFDLESDVTKETVTRKLHYVEISENVETSSVMDPSTFKLSEVTGYPTHTFMVRYDESGDQCIVRRVLHAGTVNTPVEK